MEIHTFSLLVTFHFRSIGCGYAACIGIRDTVGKKETQPNGVKQNEQRNRSTISEKRK
jgi:hypothetical protein